MSQSSNPLATKLQIGQLHLDHWLVLAPMAGITNLAFRLMAKTQGPSLVTTEMVSAKGLCLGQRRTLAYIGSDPREKPLVVQIFGSDPKDMALAAEIVLGTGADVLDINLGCPVKKVVKTGAGAALLAQPERLAAVIKEVRRAWPKPLTAKIRAGWKPDRLLAIEVSKLLADLGVDAITVHPRYASEGFSGKSDWSIISKVKRAVQIPVIGNGDVFGPEDAFRMRKMTGCDAVMIGRGAIGNPWIFSQIRQIEKGSPKPLPPTLDQRRKFIKHHFELLCHNVGQRRAAQMMRGLLFWYTKGLPMSSQFRGTISSIKDPESLEQALEAYFTALEDRGI